MRLLNPVDRIFLHLERRNQPMHVGGLQLFTLPDGADADYVRNLVGALRGFTDVQPPFDRCLHYRLGQPFWADDHSLDLEYHVRHLALPRPGEIRDLLALVSLLHSAVLDRARPLWECYVIEGVGDNRFAIYSKFHHAMMDGVSAMRVMRRSLGESAGDSFASVPWQLARASGAGKPARTSRLGSAWQSLRASTRQATALPLAGREVYRAWQDAYLDADFTSIAQAPQSMLNRRVSGSRRFAAQSYSLTRIKRLARQHGVTVNDMLLAMCASALRRYLADNNALPDAPLVAMIPLSLHSEDDDAGNRIAMILAGLATHIEDPLARLAAIHRSVAHWKHRYRDMTSEQIMAFVATLAAPAGVNLLTGLFPQRQSFNVVISNVPGPTETRYFHGARLEGMYPVSIVLDGMALNITITSYRDALEFGLIACRRALPSMQYLLQYLADALDELEPMDPAHPREDGLTADGG